MISVLAQDYPLAVVCETLGLSRNSYYHRPLERTQEAELKEAIKRTSAEWPTYGDRIFECELSVLAAQCLDQRIPDKETLIREVTAWEARRNHAGAKVIGQFTTAEARIKLTFFCNTRILER